ncbi:hypothetical protein AJ79_06013 [Helicocarpus griseus UAMH5409]|uniref:Nephrocystin 3-like N-terminal domain-containing protein n=1 Tax=Helicocarpus griseus UAMH5409 TaxID=1447875 RepID=A0A2B7XGS0_9EURO|nr:hypothetical protein AJ79_06013 [Helicocarpus griseus UAMH5409]
MADFGFEVGGFIAVVRLANEVRQRFVDAPEQFAAISVDVRGLSIILQDANVFFSRHKLIDQQARDLEVILGECHNVLRELNEWLDDNAILSYNPDTFREKSRQILKRLSWDPDTLNGFRDCITSNISILNALYSKLAGYRYSQSHIRFQRGCSDSLCFLQPSTPRRSEASEIVGKNILKQISERKLAIHEEIISLYAQHRNSRPALRVEHLMKAFASTAKLYSKIFIILDALDEHTNLDDDLKPR